MDIQNPSIGNRAVDFFKQMANKLIDTGNNVAVKYGNGAMTPRFETIADKQAQEYQTVVNNKNILDAKLRNLKIKEDPRNNNYVYNGNVGYVSPPTQRVRIATPTPTQPVNKQLVPTHIPKASPTPTPQSSPYIPNFDFTDYKARAPGFEKTKIPQPPINVGNLIYQAFAPSNEATPAAAVAWAENALSDINAIGQNYDPVTKAPTTKDYGIFQVNSGTFDGLRTAPVWKEKMLALGIDQNTPYEVLLDPKINVAVAKLVHEREQQGGAKPWSWWYGWQGKNADGTKYLGRDVNLREMINKLNKMLASKKKRK